MPNIINRLYGFRFYLCGPIDHAPDNGQHWRDNITPVLKNLNAYVIDPLKKPLVGYEETQASRQQRDIYKQQSLFEPVANEMKAIRHIDLRLVDISDVIIVYLNLDIIAVGTWEELFWANRQKKPILVMIEQGKENIPDWLFGTIPHYFLFNNADEIIAYLKYIDSESNLKLLDGEAKRWVFINFKEL